MNLFLTIKLDEEDLRKVSPQQFRNYLISKGWSNSLDKWREHEIWKHKKHDLRNVFVAPEKFQSVWDYPVFIKYEIEKLADLEKVGSFTIYEAILNQEIT